MRNTKRLRIFPLSRNVRTHTHGHSFHELEALITLTELVDTTGEEADAPEGNVLPTMMTLLLLVTLIRVEGVAATLLTVLLENTTSSR